MATPINLSNVQDWDEPLNTDPMFTSSHVFSTADLTVSFGGMTVGNSDNPLAVFDTSGANGTIETKEGITLYPIDSEFGFYVNDFVNADQKVLDGDYAEGWAGDLFVEGEQAGIVVSDSPTDTFKTPAVLGTWLAGLGGNTIKASTEHYVVMQNVLSDQKFPGDPDALYPLDNELFVIGGDYDGQSVADLLPLVGDVNEDGVTDIKDLLDPNETEIDINIAASTDYSVTLKDDGKLLYRWGNLIKKPNDVRIDAKLDLPEEWSAPDAEEPAPLFQVTAAELIVHHTITNNPNDQVRPEDFENEAAIGTLPMYEVVADYDEDGQGPREVWLSAEDYYAGDGTLYPAGTILRDDALAAQWAESELGLLGATDGAAGFTNAWYTTMNREPFEPDLNDDGTEYEIGPRWRLQPDKFGQDLPSVVIPVDASAPPPPQKDEVKYDVGAETQTVLNLLDWGAPISPLSISAGWQDQAGTVSSNGVNMTDQFDVALYIKGDIKPATVYSTELLIDYEEILPVAVGADVTGSDGDDYLVGLGANTFESGAGSDLMVLSYGSSVDGVALTASTITDFESGEDAIGLIGLGVDDVNFEEVISQQQLADGLGIFLDLDAEGADAPVLIATLEGVTEALDMEQDFVLINPASDVPVGVNVAGTEGDNFLVGTTFRDVLDGLGGNDTLYGLEGDDTLLGGDGDDLIAGYDGDDDVDGGAGDDMIGGGLGDDLLFGNIGADVIGGGLHDDLLLGGAGVDALSGGAGADELRGGLGDDDLNGGIGADFLSGGGRNDLLVGGTGDDTLVGNAGDDVLVGEEGADVFVFEAFLAGSFDTVADFELGIDKMRMHGVENAPDSGLQGYLDALGITDTAGGALVSYEGHEILVENIAAADLGLDDFVFV